MEVTLSFDSEQLLEALLAYLWTWAPSVYLLIAAAVSRLSIGMDEKSRLRGDGLFEEPSLVGPVLGTLWPVTVSLFTLYWVATRPMKWLFIPKSLRAKL